jgi:acyl-CoA synthetase (AMP-forming)/AMP-acid ligase II
VLKGRIPLGYHKDPERTASTFVELEDGRYSIPGDWAVPEPGGVIRLLGRGSQCINTGGEKVYPEEVELVLKDHPAVVDAAVVGVADERFGQAVTALVDAPGADEATLMAFVRSRLAAYKAPRSILFVDEVRRGPNGKLDYPGNAALAAALLGARPAAPTP